MTRNPNGNLRRSNPKSIGLEPCTVNGCPNYYNVNYKRANGYCFSHNKKLKEKNEHTN